MIKAVIFDAGDILLKRKEDEITEFIDKMDPTGTKTSEEKSAFLMILWDIIADKKSNYKSDISEFKQILHANSLLEITPEDIRQLEIRAFWKSIDSDSYELLKFLTNEGFKIGILTDSVNTEDDIIHILEYEGLWQYIDSITSSAECGFQKPAIEAYTDILTKLDVNAREAIFVGHDEDELEGALNAGMIPVEYSTEATNVTKYHTTKLLGLKKIILNLTNKN